MLTPADFAKQRPDATGAVWTYRNPSERVFDAPRGAQRRARPNAGRSFTESVTGFGHQTLSKLANYPKFREALADLIDETDAPLGRLLADVRTAALSSPFGAPCPRCKTTTWPHRGRRVDDTFQGRYRCSSCRHEFRAEHDITAVNWPN